MSRPGADTARILGLDPGSRNTGYGLIEKTGTDLTFLEAGVLSPPARADFSQRLHDLYVRTCDLVTRCQPRMIAVEDIFYAVNARTALKLAHARGVLILAAAQADVPVWAYPPATVKKTVVGDGAADKVRVAWMVARLLPAAPCGMGRDASDALAVALCHAAHLRRSRLVETAAGSASGAGRRHPRRPPS